MYATLQMNVFCVLPTCMILTLIPLTGSHAGKGVHEAYKDLSDFIMNCSAVRYRMPPMTVGRIDMTFEPFQILSVDERKQAATLSSLITLRWTLDNCQWSPADYSGIFQIDVDTDQLWLPIVTTPKGTDTAVLTPPRTVTLYSNGQVKMPIPGPVGTTCYLNLDLYPFDHHNCTVPFIVMNGDGLHPVSPGTLRYDLSKYFSTSAEWRLMGNGCALIKETTLNYTECWFTMERRSAFYVATLIFPIVLMSVMTLLVFCIPAESGEKMSYVISIFVSMTMFINFLVDVVPRSMAQLPRVVQLIIAVVVKIALTTAATAIVLKKYNHERAGGRGREVKVHPTVLGANTGDATIHPEVPLKDAPASDTILFVKTSGAKPEADQVKVKQASAAERSKVYPILVDQAQGQVLGTKHFKVSSKTLDSIFFCIFLASDIALYTLILM